MESDNEGQGKFKNGFAATVAIIGVSLLVTCSSAPVPSAEHHQYQQHRQVDFSGDGWNARSLSYQCAEGEVLQVVYLNINEGLSFVSLVYDGQLHPMRIWPGASGARYIAFDEQVSYRWYSQGEEGFLTFLAADHTATEERVLSDCRVVGQGISE